MSKTSELLADDEIIARRLAVVMHGDDVEWRGFITKAHHWMALSLATPPSDVGREDMAGLADGERTEFDKMKDQKDRIVAKQMDVRLRSAAQILVDLFVWQPREEGGEITPHLDRDFPHFNDALTALREALRQSTPSPGGQEDETNKLRQAVRRAKAALAAVEPAPGGGVESAPASVGVLREALGKAIATDEQKTIAAAAAAIEYQVGGGVDPEHIAREVLRAAACFQGDLIAMLTLCGDLGGKRPAETYAGYLRRLIDFVTVREHRETPKTEIREAGTQWDAADIKRGEDGRLLDLPLQGPGV